jgi:ubiquinone/menaquinone biosynthesis C-methylase UbiE
MLRVSSFVHQFLLKHLTSDAKVLDLTCGRGNDTLFCAQHFKQVVSIDIQEEALISAQLKCKEHTNIRFIHDDHQHIDQHISDQLDACVFNSGYLPQSTSSYHTHFETSRSALSKTIPQLKTGGYACIVLYRKHDEAFESTQLENFVLNHPLLDLVERYSYPNDALSPLVLIFKKRNKRA